MDRKEMWFRKQAEKFLPFLKAKKVPAEFLTLFRIIFALITAIILLFNNYFLSIIFLTIYQFIFLLDYIDGKLARHQKRFSMRWMKLDRFFHYFISFAFILALSISYFLRTENSTILVIGIIGSFLAIISSFFGMKKFKELRIEKKDYKGKLSGLYSYIGIDNPFSLFYFLILFKLPSLAILFYSFLYLLISIRKLK